MEYLNLSDFIRAHPIKMTKIQDEAANLGIDLDKWEWSSADMEITVKHGAVTMVYYHHPDDEDISLTAEFVNGDTLDRLEVCRD